MNIQKRINLLDIKDYISMREKDQTSNIKWENTKHLNTHLGKTFWQLCLEVDKEYNFLHEPSATQLDKVKGLISY